jgi:hypothetical protein
VTKTEGLDIKSIRKLLQVIPKVGIINDIVSISKGGPQNRDHERLATRNAQSSEHEGAEPGGTHGNSQATRKRYLSSYC